MKRLSLEGQKALARAAGRRDQAVYKSECRYPCVLNPDSISSSRVAVYASHWVKDVEFESVIAVWASNFALKITHAQLVV